MNSESKKVLLPMCVPDSTISRLLKITATFLTGTSVMRAIKSFQCKEPVKASDVITALAGLGLGVLVTRRENEI